MAGAGDDDSANAGVYRSLAPAPQPRAAAAPQRALPRSLAPPPPPALIIDGANVTLGMCQAGPVVEDEIELAVADFSDAFQHLRSAPEERPILWSSHGGQRLLHLATCFGLAGCATHLVPSGRLLHQARPSHRRPTDTPAPTLRG